MMNPPLLLVGSTVLKITRRDKGQFESGRYTEGTSRNVEVRANVQPILRSRDTMILPEADRSKAALKVYSSEPLRQLREGDDGWEADQFEYRGDVYEVMKVIDYDMGVLNHYKAICSRKELT